MKLVQNSEIRVDRLRTFHVRKGCDVARFHDLFDVISGGADGQ
jgi:hypothetical protein